MKTIYSFFVFLFFGNLLASEHDDIDKSISKIIKRTYIDVLSTAKYKPFETSFILTYKSGEEENIHKDIPITSSHLIEAFKKYYPLLKSNQNINSLSWSTVNPGSNNIRTVAFVNEEIWAALYRPYRDLEKYPKESSFQTASLPDMDNFTYVFQKWGKTSPDNVLITDNIKDCVGHAILGENKACLIHIDQYTNINSIDKLVDPITKPKHILISFYYSPMLLQLVDKIKENPILLIQTKNGILHYKETNNDSSWSFHIFPSTLSIIDATNTLQELLQEGGLLIAVDPLNKNFSTTCPKELRQKIHNIIGNSEQYQKEQNKSTAIILNYKKLPPEEKQRSSIFTL